MRNFDRLKAFAEKVDKRGTDDCWEWLGVKAGNGYGQFWDGQTMVGAHRYSWELFFDSIPEGKLVLHKCNNRSCVNPYHLYVGDQSDNMRDMVRSGYAGDHLLKLYKEDVDGILELLKSGSSQREVAEKFGVSQFLIYNVNKKGASHRVRKESRGLAYRLSPVHF